MHEQETSIQLSVINILEAFNHRYCLHVLAEQSTKAVYFHYMSIFMRLNCENMAIWCKEVSIVPIS